jgi:hypothetical protein
MEKTSGSGGGGTINKYNSKYSQLNRKQLRLKLVPVHKFTYEYGQPTYVFSLSLFLTASLLHSFHSVFPHSHKLNSPNSPPPSA